MYGRMEMPQVVPQTPFVVSRKLAVAVEAKASNGCATAPNGNFLYVSWYWMNASPKFFKLFWHCVRRAASRAAETAGSSSATSTPMRPIQTSSPTGVKPRILFRMDHPNKEKEPTDRLRGLQCKDPTYRPLTGPVGP